MTDYMHSWFFKIYRENEINLIKFSRTPICPQIFITEKREHVTGAHRVLSEQC